MGSVRCERVVDGLFRFEDGCNVYVLAREGKGLAIDFGRGRWLDQLRDIGVERLEHVVLTHHQAPGLS